MVRKLIFDLEISTLKPKPKSLSILNQAPSTQCISKDQYMKIMPLKGMLFTTNLSFARKNVHGFDMQNNVQVLSLQHYYTLINQQSGQNYHSQTLTVVCKGGRS